MTSLEYKLHYQRHLPHYQPHGATLFITFRLAGSLPLAVIQQLEMEVLEKETAIANIADADIRRDAMRTARKQLFARWDAALDSASSGPRWLSVPTIANMVCDELLYLDERMYTLEAYCVMPNHVHLVLSPSKNGDGIIPLSKIMHVLKGKTARQANLVLGRQGAFWQHESYDHVVRDQEELNRIVNYVLNNPRRAGLPDRWIYRKDETGL